MAFIYADLINKVATQGEFLGAGSSRQAYLWEDKVYKFAILDEAFHSDQLEFEQKTYDLVPKQLKDILPDTVFKDVVEEHEGETEEYLYSISEKVTPPNREGILALEETWHRDFTIFDFIKIIYLVEMDSADLYRYYTQLVEDFIYWLDRMGGIGEDIIYNSENYGLNSKGELKILDWGA